MIDHLEEIPDYLSFEEEREVVEWAAKSPASRHYSISISYTIPGTGIEPKKGNSNYGKVRYGDSYVINKFISLFNTYHILDPITEHSNWDRDLPKLRTTNKGSKVIRFTHQNKTYEKSVTSIAAFIYTGMWITRGNVYRNSCGVKNCCNKDHFVCVSSNDLPLL